MTRRTRRSFLKQSAAAARCCRSWPAVRGRPRWAPTSASASASWACGSAAGSRSTPFSRFPRSRSPASATSTKQVGASRSTASARHRQGATAGKGHPQGPGRQVDRRRLHRHAQPLALAGRHLGLPGRQGRARREAALAQPLRGPQAGRGRPPSPAHRPAHDAVPLRAGHPRRHRLHSGRASSAASLWPAP